MNVNILLITIKCIKTLKTRNLDIETCRNLIACLPNPNS